MTLIHSPATLRACSVISFVDSPSDTAAFQTIPPTHHFMSSSSPPTLDVDSIGCQLVGVTGGRPSDESIDYVKTKTQFQLHTLLTEQRHPKTMEMSQTITKDVQAGLTQLLSVDDDITDKISGKSTSILSDAESLKTLSLIQAGMTRALVSKRQIYIYGCGATGRLAKLMESTFWRPFWTKVKSSSLWARIQPHVAPGIESSLIGEMTGADRALISSLEGFEDLQLIGDLQLHDRGIKRGDMVIAVTEGGETSSVIGTVLAGLRQWNDSGASDEEIRSHLFMVYNNPDAVLLPFERSATVINEKRITKLNLSTGPQAITGSTRMQATTSETFVLAAALHCSLDEFFRNTVHLNENEMKQLGFTTQSTLNKKLLEFESILTSVKQALPQLATFTEWESQTYAKQHFTTYFACQGLMTVFIDSTERSPTFRLFPLDTTQAQQRKCWIQCWTAASSLEAAWQSFLGRPFHGLSPEKYEARFTQEITDEYLRATALRSLPNAGNNQAELYDFSFSDTNVSRRGGIQPGDLGCLVLMNGEEASLIDLESSQSKFIRKFASQSSASDGTPTRVSILILTQPNDKNTNIREDIIATLNSQGLPIERINVAVILNDTTDDPLAIRAQLAMKIALNAHSTGVMSLLGKVLGNCMVNVSPGNLKLIGRATFLIQLHVNQAAERAKLPTVSYALANAILYDSIGVIRADQLKLGSVVPVGGAGGQSAEVALSIVRILSSLDNEKPFSGEEALKLLSQTTLERFLVDFAAKYYKQ